MKPLLKIFSLLFSSAIHAHHTKDHMMLSQDPQQIIAATQQGNQGNSFWVLWLLVLIFLFLGLIRFWKNRP